MERRNTSTMASTTRPGSIARASMRPPVRSTAAAATRAALTRHATPASRIDRVGATSPAESLSSVTTSATAGTKRKEREFDATAADEGEATNINVVVRCRGRSEREVRENSAVAVSTEGVKGKLVELSMGPNALSNKTYSFDRVFSPAADQSMIFDDVVKPILDEMLAGYNCTIFAYGQTGTGKTYTMSGDMSDTFGLLSDAAGIIPRVLHALFNKLEIDDTDNCVACSFIELYNEELRDLLSSDEGTKLKIYDDNSRKGHATTVVQGMEERHITNAAEGLKWLQEGSVRRQVAATKCNDLSSRSHTVFTISVYIKRPGENGDDYLSAGKLNLVDLAGSENIQRSGAENKRATEAGLINKSLLTLGRVINALVDRSSHIPYRESKLTRLLQDSLGGRTKTCIIATVSPARSNLEETISTLDYAFRAKNIRNKPQLNAMINRKALLREFTIEIEKLKSELIATRQRNGVYLSNEAYEELTVQNESRRILTEEQSAKIETLETNLRSKVQELFHLTSSFMGLKKEHDGTRIQLEEATEVLDQTELVLAATRKTLAEETHIRKAHQETEEKLSALGGELLTTLKRTVDDVGGLRAKNKRKSDLQSLNRSTWAMSQAQVSSVTELVDGRIEDFRSDQEQHISSISGRMQAFVQDELAKLSSTQTFLDRNLSHFAESRNNLMEQANRSKEEMDGVLDEIKVVRDNIKQRVGESLQAIAAAAETIAANVLSELTTFHDQLHSSYSALGKDFKSIFEELLRHMGAQKSESDRLRRQLEGAGEAIVQANASVASRIQEVLDEERKQAAAERLNLLTQISTLINSQAELQESRVAGKAALIRQTVLDANKSFEGGVAQYSDGMEVWAAKDGKLVDDITVSRDVLKNKLKEDWMTANTRSKSIQDTTRSVYAETISVVEEQKRDLDLQMNDLDGFASRARSHNAQSHEQQVGAVCGLSRVVETSFSGISNHFADSSGRVHDLGTEMKAEAQALRNAIEPLEETVRQPLRSLREDIQGTVLREYEPTGDTPEKAAYQYPTALPRTAAHEALVAGLHEEEVGQSTPSRVRAETESGVGVNAAAGSASAIFNDLDLSIGGMRPLSRDTIASAAMTTNTGTAMAANSDASHGAVVPRNAPSMSLREVNPNVTATLLFDPAASAMSLPPVHENATLPIFVSSGVGKRGGRSQMARYAKKQQSGASASAALALEGRENVPPATQGGPRRKSPRLH